MSIQPTPEDAAARFVVRRASIFERLPGLLVDFGAEIRSNRRTTLFDTYFDTEDWWLYRAGAYLRLRCRDSAQILTLKTACSPRKYRVSRRLEDIVSRTEPEKTAALPNTPLVQWVSELCGNRRLRPLFRLRIERAEWDVLVSSSANVKVSADGIYLPTPRAEKEFFELEFKLSAGDRRPGEDFLKRLTRRLRLKRSKTSEFERALRLNKLKPPHPPRVSALKPRREDRVIDTATKILRYYFEVFRWNEPGTCLGLDPEYLHDMRVALRRLRAALRLFGEAFPQNHAKHFRDELRWIAGVLGPVRDIDVHLGRLDEQPTPAGGNCADWSAVFREWLRVRRDEAREVMLQALRSDRYVRFIREFDSFLAAASSARKPYSPLAAKPTLSAAPRWINPLLKKVIRKSASLTRNSPDEDFHKLRIQGKKLRYTCEFLLPLYGRSVARLARRMERLQDLLGAHQDAAVAVETVRQFLAERRTESDSEFVDKLLDELMTQYEKRAAECREKFFQVREDLVTKKQRSSLRKKLKPPKP